MTTNTSQLNLAFQGIPGAYSQQAALGWAESIGVEVDTQGCASFRELFATIQNETGIGIVPIENSTAGSVVQCFDLLYEFSDLECIAEYKLPVDHCLLGLPGAKLVDIKKVISHPQALDQCSQFTAEHQLQTTPWFDTAGSAEHVAKEKLSDTVAIASSLSAEYYDLEILARDFQNNQNNVTRFVVVRKRGEHQGLDTRLATPNKTSLIFTGRDIPADLYKCLGGFATNGVNLLKLESRPKPGAQFEYIFFLDFVGDVNDESVQLALEELRFFASEIVILGSYPSCAKLALPAGRASEGKPSVVGSE